MLPSEAGTVRGQVFPFAGGSSVKSIYSPARMRSLVFLGTEGMPTPSENCGLGATGASWILIPLGRLASSWLMAGNEVEGPRGSCTSGGGGGIVRMAEGRLDRGGRVPSLIPA